MRKLFSISILAVFVLPMLLKLMILSNYFVAYDDYLDRCENKQIESMHCNGTCQLAKELQSVENESEETPEFPRTLQVELLPFVLVSFSLNCELTSNCEGDCDTFIDQPLMDPYTEIPVPPPLAIA
jgi:hypothetical protein